MTIKVTGDQYRAVNRRLREIERQVDQRNGYPHDLKALMSALNALTEGRFGWIYEPKVFCEVDVRGENFEMLHILIGDEEKITFDEAKLRARRWGVSSTHKLTQHLVWQRFLSEMLNTQYGDYYTIIFPELSLGEISGSEHYKVVHYCGSSLDHSYLWDSDELGGTHFFIRRKPKISDAE